ncbi:hypothetical protein [Allorhodopirellula heiligendammensis]|uniref:Uncharacterized protein n=1 Tax=Allorhodopirellula heiligendammensis TaxID=2714739 RepID=A0A5C6C5U4_9BACT|nr:hypothetical protein [Allorhodopirellula heiligendammensis]TWU19528.1 hypothetical protein Poly21_17020 [Allorhodopirellula heiligendammensis]
MAENFHQFNRIDQIVAVRISEVEQVTFHSADTCTVRFKSGAVEKITRNQGFDLSRKLGFSVDGILLERLSQDRSTRSTSDDNPSAVIV